MKIIEDLFDDIENPEDITKDKGKQLGDPEDNVKMDHIYDRLKIITLCAHSNGISYIRPAVYKDIKFYMAYGYNKVRMINQFKMCVNDFDFRNLTFEYYGRGELYANHKYNGKLKNITFKNNNYGMCLGEQTSVEKGSFELDNVKFNMNNGYLCLYPSYFDYKFKKCSFSGKELIIDYSYFKKRVEDIYVNRLENYIIMQVILKIKRKPLHPFHQSLNFEALI